MDFTSKCPNSNYFSSGRTASVVACGRFGAPEPLRRRLRASALAPNFGQVCAWAFDFIGRVDVVASACLVGSPLRGSSTLLGGGLSRCNRNTAARR
jgi:hypothetical protein